MSKIKYCSGANQWCNRRVNMLKHKDLAELHFGYFGHKFWALEIENDIKSMCKLNKLRVQPPFTLLCPSPPPTHKKQS